MIRFRFYTQILSLVFVALVIESTAMAVELGSRARLIKKRALTNLVPVNSPFKHVKEKLFFKTKVNMNIVTDLSKSRLDIQKFKTVKIIDGVSKKTSVSPVKQQVSLKEIEVESKNFIDSVNSKLHDMAIQNNLNDIL